MGFGEKREGMGTPTPTAHIQCCQIWPTSQPDPLVQSPLCPSLQEPGGSPVQLLEVAIGLKAVVASISHHHVAIRGQCQALWAIQWLCRCVDIGQEGARAVEHLDTAVAPVGHDDVPIGVHSYSCGGVELPIALTMGAKLEEELSIGTVYLH